MAYQSDYHKHINEFRKGTRLRTINKDPTYLSWFLMFDWQSESSPLFNGAANKYLEQVVGGEYGKALSKRLTSFHKSLNEGTGLLVDIKTLESGTKSIPFLITPTASN